MPHASPTTEVTRVDIATGSLNRIALAVQLSMPEAQGAAILSRDGSKLRVVGASGAIGLRVDQTLAHHGSLAGACIRSARTIRCSDVMRDPRAHRLPAVQGARSVVCAPLGQGEGSLGVIEVFSPNRSEFSSADEAALLKIARFVEIMLGRASEADEINAAQAGPRRLIETVLADEALDIALQPIVDLRSGQTLAAEALARFPQTPVRPPDVWFDDAHRNGLGIELESLAVRKAIALLPHVPVGARMSVNASHELLVSGRLPALLSGIDGGRIMLELTEHEAFADYATTADALAVLRAYGVCLAIDDVGAGFSSFRHIVELAPECIKLDRLFIDGITTDPTRRAMARALVEFSREIGAQLVAEGIETERQLECALQLGIVEGQGYLVARPSEPASIADRYEHILGTTPIWAAEEPIAV